MAQKLDPKETASLQEITYTNMLQQETLTRLLIKAGVFSRDEYNAEYKALIKEMEKKQGE
jgi:hypothetical protein